MLLGQYEEARAHAQAGLALARETGTPWVIASALDQLGWLALVEGAYAEAHDLYRESLAIYQHIGRQSFVHVALVSLGYAARGLGRLPQAGEYLSDALRMAAEAGHFRPLVGALPAMALLLADRGEPERAVELYALACTLGAGYFGRVGDSRFWEDVAGRHIAAAAAALPPDVVAAAKARGRARDLHATVAELLAEFGEE
jgi:tetratricopeptide (TPR) repeat protein